MKKILFLTGLGVLLLAGVCFFFRANPTAGSKRTRVVTSGYVPYTLTKQLSGGLLEVEMLLPPNAEPHSFEPSPGSLVAVHHAAALVYVSDRLEPWVQAVLGAAGKDTRVVSLADGLAQTEDPHVWMDFGAVVDMARTVVAVLTEIDPPHAAVYRDNLLRFEQEIAVLDRDFAATLANCQTREMVHIGHLAFAALAKRYNLSLRALAGTSHDGEHSARKLADLVKHIRAQGVHALFTEEAVSPRLSSAVAAETGAEILPLYPVEYVSKEDFNQGVSYSQFMRRNLESLQKGLKCQP